MAHTPEDAQQPEAAGFNRRALLQRTAIVGGAMVWTLPIVQSVGSKAFAAAGSRCIGYLTVNPAPGICFRIAKLAYPEGCCDCATGGGNGCSSSCILNADVIETYNPLISCV